MKKIISLLLTIAIIISAFLVQGCTLIGRGIGASIDGGSHERGYLEIGKLELGDEKEFILRDGQPPLRAVFQYLDTLNTEDYLLLYDRISTELNSDQGLPRIGDTLLGIDTFLLCDFGYEYVESKYKPLDFIESQFIYLRARSQSNGQVIKINLV